MDPDGNDTPKVHLMQFEGQEDNYPDFIEFDNSTNVIEFKPSQEHAGRDFYYKIIVKEQNSESVFYPYYCRITVTGEPIEEEPEVMWM